MGPAAPLVDCVVSAGSAVLEADVMVAEVMVAEVVVAMQMGQDTVYEKMMFMGHVITAMENFADMMNHMNHKVHDDLLQIDGVKYLSLDGTLDAVLTYSKYAQRILRALKTCVERIVTKGGAGDYGRLLSDLSILSDNLTKCI